MQVKKVDLNQPEIIEQAKKLGMSVQSLHTIGKDCPDVLFGYAGINILCEIKNGNNDLSEGQKNYHDNWQGQIATVRNIDDVVIEFLRYSNGMWSTIQLLEMYGRYLEMKNV
jgi:hypothetical protein